jgi:hypothetical protein
MALIYRNGRPRLQRSVRRDGKVTSRYEFSGDWAVELAGLKAKAREARAVRRRAEAHDRDELRAAVQDLDGLCRAATALAREVLQAAGYHQHARGEWRRKRAMASTSKPETVLVEVRPDQTVMDLWAQGRIIGLAAGKSSQETQDHIRRDIDQHAADLAGLDPSPVEASLARTAAICWAAMRTFEARYFGTCDQLTIPQSDFALRRVEHCHRRYLSTIKALAQVRKLALPTVQVNVGRNQLNVADTRALGDDPPRGEGPIGLPKPRGRGPETRHAPRHQVSEAGGTPPAPRS